ncbi:MAG: hypothetical protein Q4B94_03975 [Pseudomonadota bacterium]|nr:hypothetical protein [Pseudomonadota bacterium]
MQCEKCHSDNTQRLQVVYEGGTQNISATSRTTGIGIGGGGLGVGVASTQTTGISRSTLAYRAAPPAKQRYVFALFLGFLAWLLWVYTSAFSKWFLLSSAVIALCGYWAYRVYTFNNKVWPELMAYWENEWLCLKCGHIYHHE